MYRGLVQSLLDKGRIETTQAKAKAVIGEVDRIVSLLKENSVNSRRELLKILGNDKMFDRMFAAVTDEMQKRTSGFARIIKLGRRLSDNAEMVILELVDRDLNPEIKTVAVKETIKKVLEKQEIKEGKIVERPTKKTAKKFKPIKKFK